MSLVDGRSDSGMMPGMNPAKHAPAKIARTPGLGAAWAVLIGTGVTSVTFNVVHATQGAHLEVVLALLLGLAPAFVAAFLSHVAAVLEAPRWVIAAVIAVMGAGMVLSASATASVVAPADPSWRGWLFGCTLDAAALLALWAILTARGKRAAAVSEAESARVAVAEARAEVLEAAGERSRLEAELASVSAELVTVKSAQAALAERVSKRKAARKSARPDDLTTELRAVKLLDEDRSLRAPRMGGELARRLGVSPATGRRLHARLTAQGAIAEPLSDRSAKSSDARSGERS